MTDNCHVTRFNKEVVLENEQVETIILDVTRMGCPNCANRVHNRLIDHPGVAKAEIHHETGKVEVAYIPAKISLPQLIDLVAEAGDNRHTYQAALFETGGA